MVQNFRRICSIIHFIFSRCLEEDFDLEQRDPNLAADNHRFGFCCEYKSVLGMSGFGYSGLGKSGVEKSEIGKSELGK